MRRSTKLLSLIAAAAVFAGCSDDGSGHDEPGQPSATLAAESLAAMESHLGKYPDRIGFHPELSHWGFTTPAGDKFEWTADTAANVADLAVVLLADPLVAAGVDPNALQAKGWLYNPATTGDHSTPAVLIKPYDLDSTPAGPAAGTQDGAAAAFRRIVERFPARIGFHHELDHYGLTLSGAEKFEWAKNLSTNTIDLAFVLEADDLLSAGADVSKLKAAGWVYSEATTGEHASPALLIKPVSLD